MLRSIRIRPTWAKLLTVSLFASAASPIGCGGAATPDGPTGDAQEAVADYVTVPLPEGIEPSDLAHLSEEAHAKLDQAIRRALSLAHGGVDVVVLVDANGRRILPNADAARMKGPMETLSGNELSFTYNSPTTPWTSTELADVQSWVTACYPVAKTLYGPPAFTNTVNIQKGDTGGFSGYYVSSTNEITISPFSVQGSVACHEMIHAFHDDYILGLSSWEEGMTRAAEVEVTKRAGISNSVDHSYYYDVHYQELNLPAIGAKGGNIFAGWSQTLLRYQLAGYAWAKPMLEDNAFFVNFNSALYTQAFSDPTVPSSETKLKTIVAGAKSQVENTTFSTWYGQQGVLNTSPPTGNILYVRASDLYSSVISILNRDTLGNETNVSGVTVSWSMTNDVGTVVSSGSDVTTAYGIISPSPTIPPAYTGRIKLSASATVSSVLLSASAYLRAPEGTGVYGVVVGATSGTITFTPLDQAVSPVTVSVSHGAFDAPTLLSVKGRIQYVFTSGGTSTAAKVLTKDETPYFVHVTF